MIFDFLKKRAQEGIEQMQNIATKTMEGKFQEALSDTNSYIKARQQADSENFQRLISGFIDSFALISTKTMIFFFTRTSEVT